MAKRILLVTNKIMHYRLPLYERIGRLYDLTIAHEGTETGSTAFRERNVKVTNTGPFRRYQFNEDLNAYDVIIVYANVWLINLYQLAFLNRNRKFKLILYGIGVSASYTRRYDSSRMYSWLMKKIIDRSDAMIFYDSYPTIRYASLGVNPAKLFVAHNTVEGNTAEVTPHTSRKSLLFIGSLYMQKGIGTLLEAYKLNITNGRAMPVLNIIGDGPERNSIADWLDKNNLTEQVRLLGSITEEKRLKNYFEDAIVCISPGQAGLSVQKAFSYGVPFITSYYPFSGGEFTSIIEGVTGFYYDGSVGGLASAIIEVLDHPQLDEISRNCYVFYHRFRSPAVWEQGFTRAINYALGK